ncbi:hypothetical protein K8I31_22000, partial [bacterium]|nr:hypothetical protein [bacterium]
WYKSEQLFREPEKRKINDAISNIEKRKREITPGRVVAELNFGFWCSLTKYHEYEELWRRCLRKILMKDMKITRKTFSKKLEKCRVARNRVAHYEEIIFHYAPEIIYQQIVEIISFMSLDSQKWIEVNNSFHANMKNCVEFAKIKNH